MEFQVYILHSQKLNRFYIGTTDNIEKRLNQYNSVVFKDAFSSKGIPWSLFLSIPNLHSEQAFHVEKHIKRMKSKVYIQNLKKFPELRLKLVHLYK